MARHTGRPIWNKAPCLFIGSILAVAFATGCAGYPDVVVDMQGKAPVQTNRDLAYCRNRMMSEVSWGEPSGSLHAGEGLHRPFGGLMDPRLIALAVVASLFPQLAQAQSAQKKAEAACEERIVRKLTAPLEAKVIPASRKHVNNQYTVCYQARTAQGGFGFAFAFGVCNYGSDGSVDSIKMVDGATGIRSDVSLSGTLCRN